MTNALQHSRTRYPGLVNPSLSTATRKLIFKTNWSDVDGPYEGPSFDKTGDQLWIDFGDGSAIERLTGSNDHMYVDDSDKIIQVWPSDGWSGVRTFYTNWGHCRGPLVNPHMMPNIVEYVCDNNEYDGSIPNMSSLSHLTIVHVESNMITGKIPDFSPCLELEEFYAHSNGLSDYTDGSFSSQPNLSTINLGDNSFPQSVIDAILADLVDSLGVSDRVTCYAILDGSNAAPSSMVDHDTLEAAGWTVDVN